MSPLPPPVEVCIGVGTRLGTGVSSPLGEAVGPLMIGLGKRSEKPRVGGGGAGSGEGGPGQDREEGPAEEDVDGPGLRSPPSNPNRVGPRPAQSGWLGACRHRRLEIRIVAHERRPAGAGAGAERRGKLSEGLVAILRPDRPPSLAL